jgi:hypothetical protein
MTTPVTCSRCGDLIRSTAEQVEVRVEYRSVKGLRRLRTWRVRMVCRACAMDEWTAHDHPHGRPTGEQEGLW